MMANNDYHNIRVTTPVFEKIHKLRRALSHVRDDDLEISDVVDAALEALEKQL